MIPDYLKSTYDLIQASFPERIDETSYFPLLQLLSEYMSQGNLADIITICTGRDLGRVSNDVLAVDGMTISEEVLEKVRTRLKQHGYDEWAASP